MKKIRNLLAVLAFILPGDVFALDLTLSGGAGNIAFEDDRESSQGQAEAGFNPRLYPLGRILIEGEYLPGVNLNAGFERDAVLKNRIFTNVIFRLGFIKLEFGPFMGLFNTREKPVNPGVSAALGLEFPGILFGSIQGASTLGPVLKAPGNYQQKTGSLTLGFWVPHVICAFNVTMKDFSQWVDQKLFTRDEQIRYQFLGDIYAKDVPYRIHLAFGYQKLKRSYTLAGITETDELNALFAGFDLVFTPRSTIGFFLGAEIPFYFWEENLLKGSKLNGPDSRPPLFQAHGGFIWTLPKKP